MVTNKVGPRSLLLRQFVAQNFDFILYATISIAYCLVCPFVKVEEKTTMQMLHDLLYHFPDTSKFDIFKHPDPVGRTFSGPIVMAALCYPFKLAIRDKFSMSIVARCIIAIVTSLSWAFCGHSVRRVFGTPIWVGSTIITATQFHVMFYASRTLFNIYSLNFVPLAVGLTLRGHKRLACALIAVLAANYRFEMASLFSLLVLLHSDGARAFVRTGLFAGLVAITTLFGTVPIDSLLLRQLIWPELSSFYFNVILNQSHLWGVSPWHWYFTHALPSALTAFYLPACLGLLSDRRVYNLCLPFVAFTAVMSIMPHKELRFIFHACPLFNVAAASFLLKGIQSKSRLIKNGTILTSLGMLFLQIAITMLKLYASHLNYPTGYAIQRVHETVRGPASIHIDRHAGQNGYSLFAFVNPEWSYDSTEGVEEFSSYSHLITSTPSRHPDFKVLESFDIFDRVKIDLGRLPRVPLQFLVKPEIYLMAKAED